VLLFRQRADGNVSGVEGMFNTSPVEWSATLAMLLTVVSLLHLKCATLLDDLSDATNDSFLKRLSPRPKTAPACRTFSVNERRLSRRVWSLN
jgi:hypothetical protein